MIMREFGRNSTISLTRTIIHSTPELVHVFGDAGTSRDRHELESLLTRKIEGQPNRITMRIRPREPHEPYRAYARWR